MLTQKCLDKNAYTKMLRQKCLDKNAYIKMLRQKCLDKNAEKIKTHILCLTLSTQN